MASKRSAANLNANIISSPPGIATRQQTIIAEVLAALQADQLELPVLPDMALKIQNLLADPDSSTGQFVQLISTDLAITLYVMKAANIAAFSNGHRVGNLNDAISRLGYRMLYSIIMNITLTRLFQARSPLINKRLKDLWKHSQLVAANSFVLSQNKKHLKPEDAMLAGLVHEIGALPLYLYTDRHYPKIDAAALDSLINSFSAPIGYRLLQSWNFPEALVDVIAEQLNLWLPHQSEHADYVDVITMARLHSQKAAKRFSWRNIPAAERLGYYPGDCKNFRFHHAEQFAVVNGMLGIHAAPAA